MTRKAAATGDLENWMKNPHVACRVIPGTDPPAIIDLFKRIPLGSFTFFLSHFHSDHYGGLSRSWTRGVVHCSAVTGRMLSRSLGVDSKYVNQLEFDTEYFVGGASVTLVDANHCPGAAMLLFRTRDGRVYLHTGDFRFDPQMLQRPILRQRKIDILYLDTTYANADYTFVSQSESLRQAVDISKKTLASGTSARTLFLVGSYSTGAPQFISTGVVETMLCAWTGKEKVAFALAEANGWRIYAGDRRRCILDCQDLSAERRALITDSAAEASVHLVPMSTVGAVLPYFRPNFMKIQSYLKDHNLVDIFGNVVGLLPTGWALTTKWNKEHAVKVSGSTAVYILQYSEHSSYAELRTFVLGLNPALVVPTVFSGSKHYDTLVKQWQPSKLAAQLALEKAQQQATRHKREGDAVEEDKSQRRITSFFRHKSSVSVTSVVDSVEEVSPPAKAAPVPHRGLVAKGTQSIKAAAPAVAAVCVALEGGSIAGKGPPRKAAADGGETANFVLPAATAAAATAVREVASTPDAAVPVCSLVAGATTAGATAAPCQPCDNGLELTSERLHSERAPVKSSHVCSVSNVELKKSQADSAVVKEEPPSAYQGCTVNGSGCSSTSGDNGRSSGGSQSFEGSGNSSRTSVTSSRKFDQSKNIPLAGIGVCSTGTSVLIKNITVGTVSSTSAARKGLSETQSISAADQTSRAASVLGSASCTGNTGIHITPTSIIQKKSSVKRRGLTAVSKDCNSGKRYRLTVSDGQIKINPSSVGDHASAAGRKTQLTSRTTISTEKEIIEIADD